jgi:LysR family hydrogen peroxide-inducible transcriptional activator
MTTSLPTLRELQHFAAVAEAASFAKGAAACGLTQPAISRSISRLEDVLGVQLLERTTHYVRLTPFGETALNEARTILDRVAGLKNLAAQATTPLASQLRIGVIPTLCPYLLPHILPALRDAHPELSPSITEAQTDALLAALTQRELDAALLALPVPSANLLVHPLFTEPFWFAAPAGHPLERMNAVTDHDLVDEPILLLAEGHCFRDQALDVCRTSGADPHGMPDVTATSIETLVQLVRTGTGTTLVPALSVPAIQPQTSDVVLRPVESSRPQRRIALVHRAGDWRSQAFALLAETMRGAVPRTYVRPIAGETIERDNA